LRSGVDEVPFVLGCHVSGKFVPRDSRLPDMVCLTAIGLTPGGSSTVNVYTQTIHRTTQFTN